MTDVKKRKVTASDNVAMDTQDIKENNSEISDLSNLDASLKDPPYTTTATAEFIE